MTAEKRLESTLRALRLNWTNEDGLQKTADEAIDNPVAVLDNPFTSDSNRALLDLYMDALNEIERKRTPGGSAALSALKRFCAESDSGHRFSGIDRIGEGEKWVMACYSRAVRLNRKPETIPEQDKENRYAAQIDAIMRDAANNSPNETELPSPADVKKHIADWKAKHPHRRKARGSDFPYNLPGTPVWVDPEKLLDMLTLFPDARVFYSSAVNAVYFKSNDPDSLCELGILMPVRYTEESAETESA